MKASRYLTALTIPIFFCTMLQAQPESGVRHHATVSTAAAGIPVQPTMYGIFFEDINFAADGGLYAEMVENRSFEAPQTLQGWDMYGTVAISDARPAFGRNPHYASLLYPGHDAKITGLRNRGYFGMGLKEGAAYDFSVYTRLHEEKADTAMFKVQLLDRYENVLSDSTFTITSKDWEKVSAVLSSDRTDGHGTLRILLLTRAGVDIDHVSLFPSDNVDGMRPDLVQDLADLHPGVFRFPGGCIVEGTELETRYDWKKTIGPAENRPMNINRWNNTFWSKMAPNYYQSLGLGFYEYFLLAERIGASPLPVVSVGLACQFQNEDELDHVAVDDLGPYIQDALDLIEFANGPADSKWGAVRAQMGHPEPFGMKHIGIGNEQWGELYPERLEPFLKAVRERYPEIAVVGSAGPWPSGEEFDFGWKEMARLGVELVDEHYYKSPEWFLSHADRYDSYNREGPKVFAGEYAAHIDQQNGKAPYHDNTFLSALAEAAFMTGLERNADVVYMTAYAPLFAHAEGWQWSPDLIWFDNLTSVRTPNWHVQSLFSNNAGTRVLPLNEDGRALSGQDSLYAAAAIDEPGGEYILKLVNASDEPRILDVTFEGAEAFGRGTATSLHAADDAFNTSSDRNAVVPVTRNFIACEMKDPEIIVTGNMISITVPARTFMVVRIR